VSDLTEYDFLSVIFIAEKQIVSVSCGTVLEWSRSDNTRHDQSSLTRPVDKYLFFTYQVSCIALA